MTRIIALVLTLTGVLCGQSTTRAEYILFGGGNREAGKCLTFDTRGRVITMDCPSGGGGGAVASVFGRTGTVTATSGDYTAAQILFTPGGGIIATTVAAAIAELDAEKAALSHTHAPGDLTTPTNHGTLVANGSAWQVKTLPACDPATQKLHWDQNTRVWQCQTDGGGEAGNVEITFTNETTVTIPAETHAFGHRKILAGCRDSSGNALEFGSANINQTTFVGQVQFLSPTTGTCILNGSGGGGGGGGGGGSNNRYPFVAAFCDGGVPASGFDLPVSDGAQPACFGTTQKFGALAFVDGTAKSATVWFKVRSDIGVPNKLILDWFSASTSTNSLVWGVATACVGPGEDLLNPTFNAEQTLADANLATANTRNLATLNSLTTTGCDVDDYMGIRVRRLPDDASDSLSATGNLLHLEAIKE